MSNFHGTLNTAKLLLLFLSCRSMVIRPCFYQRWFVCVSVCDHDN